MFLQSHLEAAHYNPSSPPWSSWAALLKGISAVMMRDMQVVLSYIIYRATISLNWRMSGHEHASPFQELYTETECVVSLVCHLRFAFTAEEGILRNVSAKRTVHSRSFSLTSVHVIVFSRTERPLTRSDEKSLQIDWSASISLKH